MPLLAGSSTNTGSTLGTSATTVASGGSQLWSSTGNAYSTSGYASASLSTGQQTVYLVCKGFGFSIPTTSTILGIVFSYKGYGNVNSVAQDYKVSLINAAGTPIGTYKNNSGYLSTTPTTITYGSSSDSWGTSLTPAIVNATGFGIGLSLQSVTGSVGVYANSMSLTVYYSSSSIWFDDDGGDIGIPPPVQYQTRMASIRVPATSDEAATTLTSWNTFNPGTLPPWSPGLMPAPEYRFWSNPARLEPQTDTTPLSVQFTNQLPIGWTGDPALPVRIRSMIRTTPDPYFLDTSAIVPKLPPAEVTQPRQPARRSDLSLVLPQQVFGYNVSQLNTAPLSNQPIRTASRVHASPAGDLPASIQDLGVVVFAAISALPALPARTSSILRTAGTEPTLSTGWRVDPVLLGLSWLGRDQQPLPKSPVRTGETSLTIFDTASSYLFPIREQQPDRIRTPAQVRIPSGDPVSLSSLVWSYQVQADLVRPVQRLRTYQPEQPVTNLGDLPLWATTATGQQADRIALPRRIQASQIDDAAANNLSNTNATNPQYTQIHAVPQVSIPAKVLPRLTADTLVVPSLTTVQVYGDQAGPVFRTGYSGSRFEATTINVGILQQIVVIPGQFTAVAGGVFCAGAVSGNARIN
jgi:hypothetical protein